jgi:DNA topoisomerase-1
MEDDLDEIANGVQETVPWLSRFYFGLTDAPGHKYKVNDRHGEIDARAINTKPLGVTADG